MKIKVTSGHYGPRDDPDGWAEYEEEFKARQPETRAEEHAGGDGKVLYSLVGERAVPHEMRQAARWAILTACSELRISKPIQVFWIAELSAREKSYLERHPEDRDMLEVFERDGPCHGFAVPARNAIFLNAAPRDPLAVIATAAHETCHIQQPDELLQDGEAAERDAQGFAALFVAAFFSQLFESRRVYR